MPTLSDILRRLSKALTGRILVNGIMREASKVNYGTPLALLEVGRQVRLQLYKPQFRLGSV